MVFPMKVILKDIDGRDVVTAITKDDSGKLLAKDNGPVWVPVTALSLENRKRVVRRFLDLNPDYLKVNYG